MYLFPADLTETLSVPLDHRDPRGKQITISYTLSQPYEEQKETILLLEDPLDNYFQQGMELRELANEFNLVQIKGRHQSKVLLNTLRATGETDWSKAYQLLNVDQHARDLERVRKALPGDQPVHLVGFSGAAAYLHYYLSLYPEKVSSLISFNPLLFDLQKNLNFQTRPAVRKRRPTGFGSAIYGRHMPKGFVRIRVMPMTFLFMPFYSGDFWCRAYGKIGKRMWH